MNLLKKLAAGTLAGAMMLSLAACGSSSSSAPVSGAASGSTASTTGSNVLNVMVEVEVASLDPQLATDGTSFEVIANYTDGLMQMDADGQSVPAIAETYEVSEDGLTYTFHLREDAVWSNGDPVTADDFVFGWQRAVDPANASEYAYMIYDVGQIKNGAAIAAGEMDVTELGVTAVDEHTLQVELEVPVSYFLSLMYFPTFYPVNRAFYESLDEGTFGTSPETVLSNGAFILDSYEPAALSFSLVKNPDYYDADNIQLDGLNYQVIKDSQQALMSYQNGDLDITKISGDQVDQAQGDPELSVHGAGYLWYITMNSNDVEMFNNVNMRLALTHAVDRESIVNDVVKDGSLATYTAVPPQFATGPDGSDFSEDQEMFSEYCSYDPEKAAEYFATACDELGTDTFEFELLVEDTTESQNVAAVLKEQIETIQTRLPISIRIGGMAVSMGAVIGLILGVVAALNHNKWLDSLCTVISVLGVSVPSYVFALGLSYLLGFKYSIFPMLYDKSQPLVSSIMPSIALGMFTMASIARFTRNEMLEVLDSDYMLLAESKGISGAPLIVRHALRNALIPIITVLAPLIVDLMTGSLVVEKIFSIPGVGSLLVTAIQSNDYNVVIALSFIYSAMYIGIMLVVDILYGVIDPRIRVSKEGNT